MKLDVIILAAGQGSRMKLNYNKMFYKIDNMTIIEKSVLAFFNNNYIDNIIVTYNENELTQIKRYLDKYNPIYVKGGNERFESVANALAFVKSEYVLIHDGARCFITNDLINKISEATFTYNATCLGVKSKDTIHLCDENNYIIDTTQRNNTFIAQTPQGFKSSLIKDVYKQVIKNNDITITDDVMAFRKYCDLPIKLITSSYDNIKITTTEDIKC